MRHNISSPMMRNSIENFNKTNFDNMTSMVSKNDIIISSLYALSITTIALMVNIYLGFTNPGLMYILSAAGGIGTLALGFVLFFTKTNTSNMMWTTLFAVLQGLVVGGFTFGIGSQSLQDGTSGWTLVGQAVIGSISAFFISFLLYALNIVRPSNKFRSILSVVFLGFFGMYGINFVITLVTGRNLLLAEGPLPIIIAVAAIILGAIRVITDIQDCDYAIKSHMPQSIKWQLSSSIVSSLIWMYTEILRLLYLLQRD